MAMYCSRQLVRFLQHSIKLGLACCLVMASFAGADTSEPSTNGWRDDFDGTLYLGVGKGFHQTLVPGLERELNNDLLFVISGELQWRNFFIETPIHRSGTYIYSATIGYRFYQHEQHSWDLIASNYNVWLPNKKTSSATPQLEGLKARAPDSLNAIRYQFLWQQHVFGFESGIDLAAHHGIITRLSYSYLLPCRNLDVYLSTALTLESSNVVNYYYGIDADEARPGRALYRAGAGYKTHFGVSAVYPLAKHWQLDASVGLNLFSRNYRQSPVVTRDQEKLMVVMVRYVF